LRSRISLHVQVFVCSWFMASGDHFWWWEQRLKVTLWRVGCWPKNLNANLSPLVMMHYTGCIRLMGVFTLAEMCCWLIATTWASLYFIWRWRSFVKKRN
jgi:hypothetical protein